MVNRERAPSKRQLLSEGVKLDDADVSAADSPKTMDGTGARVHVARRVAPGDASTVSRQPLLVGPVQLITVAAVKSNRDYARSCGDARGMRRSTECSLPTCDLERGWYGTWAVGEDDVRAFEDASAP